MIRLQDVSIVFQGRPLFAGINLQVTERSRIGLVGVNGSGKSTLLKILANIQEVDSGKVLRSKSFSVGYLPQELQTVSKETVFEEALAGCGTAREVQLKLEEVTAAMHETDPATEEYEELIHEHGRLHRLFEAMDGFAVESRTSRVLQGLAIPQEWWKLPVTNLSGGWQMRVQLARLLLSAPSLLLLDEPTNHLDVESIVWLSSFLRGYEGGVILISHDRYFLDENIAQIIELRQGMLHFFAGNYSFYEKEKGKRQELLLQAYQRQQEEIERVQKFIDRFRYKASKARQVQSRIKSLEKMERIEIQAETDQIRLRLSPAPRSSRVVLEASQLGHAFGSNRVFSDLNFKVERGEKVAIVGVNGAGKTTLLRILAQTILPLNGAVKIGENVFPAYYSQIVSEQMGLQNTILQELTQAGTYHNETQLRSLLGAFLFSGEQVYKKIAVLSGGEKSRVALAKILLQPSNLLLLDEPTNHLDMNSKEILLEALQQYDGTIVFIAHDRYFMDALATRVLELKDGAITSYSGTYSDYIRKISPVPELNLSETPREETNFHKGKEKKKLEAEQRARQSKYKKEVLLPLQELEAAIELQELELKSLEKILADDSIYQEKGRFHDYLQRYNTIKDELESNYHKWEELHRRSVLSPADL